MRRLAVPLVVLTLVATGCGSGGDAAHRPSEHVRASVLAQPADLRRVVYTAELTVRVADASRASEQASQVAGAAGGIVFAQSSDLTGRRQAHLTVKVPPERFEPVLAELARLGRPLEQDVKAEDVTEDVVDLEGRLRTAQASADRLRGLIAGAGSTAEIVAVESELAKRESEIESLQGRFRVLTGQVELATIVLTLTELGGLTVRREMPGFLRSLHAGLVALANVLLAAAAVAGFLLPFTPFGAAAWWLVHRRKALRRRRSPTG